MGVRVRMPRQSLSVILRGWHPLVANRTEKSAIAAYWEAASRSVPRSWCHPRASPFQGSLPRCQCIGCRLGRLSLLLGYTSHFTSIRYMHRPPHSPAPLHHLHSIFAHYAHASVTKKSQRVGSSSKYIYGCAAATNIPKGPNPNTEFPISRPFSRYGQKTHRSEERREANPNQSYLANHSTEFEV